MFMLMFMSMAFLVHMSVVVVVTMLVGVGVIVMVTFLVVVFIGAAVFRLLGLDWIDLRHFGVSHPSDYGHSIWIAQQGKEPR